jgi:hypothetical protein
MAQMFDADLAMINAGKQRVTLLLLYEKKKREELTVLSNFVS